jgi:endonuclease YncB( thermonuclease family)
LKNLAQLLITLLLSGCHSSKVSEITVIGIKDGDTIELIDERNQTQTIRLLNIDCPEKG